MYMIYCKRNQSGLHAPLLNTKKVPEPIELARPLQSLVQLMHCLGPFILPGLCSGT